MKFKAEHNNSINGFIVKKGRTSKGMISHIGTVFDTLEAAQLEADKRNAMDLLEQARKLIKGLSLEAAQDAAYEAVDIARDIDRRIEATGESDVGGWRC